MPACEPAWRVRSVRWDSSTRHWSSLTVALELDPLNVEAYHNRAVIHERQRRTRPGHRRLQAPSLRYAPDYEPSRAALASPHRQRCGDQPPRVLKPSSRPTFSQSKASQAARRGDYEAAQALLDRAAIIAPDYSLVYQYRSNVAYLMRRSSPVPSRPWSGPSSSSPTTPCFDENLEQLRQRFGHARER